MKKLSGLVLLIFFIFLESSHGQDNTIGLLSIDKDLISKGYTLIYPEGQSSIFLLNECGEIVREWNDSSNARASTVAKLLKNGNILRSKFYIDDPNSTFNSGGASGIVEIINWDNELIWQYQVSDSLNLQHHDVHFTEHETVMMIIWEKKELNEIVDNGFDTVSYVQREIWSDFILEVDPATDSIVWEWHAWDHLVQDYDSTKMNYGNIADHSERIDINYQEYTFNRPDWLHFNSIDYNPLLDQIIVSSKHFNEIWIIDHSTTKLEASGSTGGNSNRGGDLLFRWGNPYSYKNGVSEDQQLFSQHDARWIDEDDINPNYEYFGKISLFNNTIDTELSLGQILEPEFDSSTNSYLLMNERYLPENFSKEFSHPDTVKNYSPVASSMQIIGDGNVVMCAGRQGRSFELTPEGELAWEYLTPLKQGFNIPQGFILNTADNFTFQIQKYLEDHPAFVGKNLEPIGFIELEPNPAFCTLVDVENLETYNNDFTIFPNPIQDLFFIENKNSNLDFIQVFDMMGNLILEKKITLGKEKIDTSEWESGIYFIGNSQFSFFQKIIIQR